MVWIYDFLAELCSLIISSCCDDTVFVHYSCISPKLKAEIREGIFQNVSCLFSEQNTDSKNCVITLRQLQQEDLNEQLCTELNNYVEYLNSRSDVFSMIGLVQVLDEGLKDLLSEKIREYQSDSFSVVLNTNRESTGVGLLPRCSCLWERSHRLSHSYNRLDNFMFNLLLMENSILGELIDKHIFLKNEMFPDFRNRGQIKIGASPLRQERHFVFEYFERDNVQLVQVDYDNKAFSEDNELIWQKIILSAEKHCDIVVFPELLGNTETVSNISSRLKSLTGSERKKFPSLIILPSVSGNYMNTVTVLDRAGEIICRQSKQNPHRIENGEQGFLEDIKTNRVVNILHFEGIGRIAILICKDFLTTKYMEQLMRCFKLTLIIVPSFSTGSYDFCQSFDLCAHDDCNVIWINTCSAFEQGKETNFKNIGYVRKRIGRNDDDSQKLCEMPVCQGAFNGRCVHNCFYTEIIRGV